MTEPVRDRAQINSGTEQINGGAVSHAMRMQTFSFQGGRVLGRSLNIFAQNDAHAEAGQGCATVITEDDFRTGGIKAVFFLVDVQQLGRLWPQWTDAFLSAFASQQDRGWRGQTQVGRPDANDLTDSRPGIKHQVQQAKIPAPVVGGPVDGPQDGLDLGELQILPAQVAKEAVDGAQTNIARAALILAPDFEVIEEGRNALDAELFDSQAAGVLSLAGGKLQQQFQTVPVTLQRVGTHRALDGEVVRKKPMQSPRQDRRGSELHRLPPWLSFAPKR